MLKRAEESWCCTDVSPVTDFDELVVCVVTDVAYLVTVVSVIEFVEVGSDLATGHDAA